MKLEKGKFYHIYNRGINGTDLFYEERNYEYFLSKYSFYLSDYIDTYAYCLLKNHFHLLIKVKLEFEIKSENNTKGLHNSDNIVSKKFSDFFNSYTKSINAFLNRTGGLFETPFRRIEVDNFEYFKNLVWYIHFNPQKHGFTNDFREYNYSSYQSFISSLTTKLKRTDVISEFESIENFKKFHDIIHKENEIQHLIID